MSGYQRFDGEDDTSERESSMVNNFLSELRDLNSKITRGNSEYNKLIDQLSSHEGGEVLMRLQTIQDNMSSLCRSIAEKMRKSKEMEIKTNMISRRFNLDYNKLSNNLQSQIEIYKNLQAKASKIEKDELKHKSKSYQSEQLIPGFSYEQGENSQAQMMEEEGVTIEELHARNEAIQKLESDMKTINTLFVDVANLVTEQGIRIETIEDHMEQSYSYVTSASTELTKAKEYQSGSTKKKFIIIAVLVVILVIIILIVYFTTRKNNKDNR